MLCPSVFQPPPVSMGPLLDLGWPLRSLWPETRPLRDQVEQELLRHLQEARRTVEHMEQLHQRVFQELDRTSTCAGALKPIAFRELAQEGGFALSLDTQDFSPRELTVSQAGRRLRVSGRTEKKREDGGSYSYTCQEFRQELHLPEGVDPRAVSCSLVGGRLQIQAPRERAPGDGKERVVPIVVVPSPAIGGPEGSGGSSSSETPPQRP